MRAIITGHFNTPTPQVSLPSRHESGRLLFFVLLFLKPALLGPATEITGFGLAIKLIDLIFVLYLLAYVFLNADYFFLRAGRLLVITLFFCSTFFVSELFNEGKLFHAIYESLKFVTPVLAFLVLFRETGRDPEIVARYSYLILASLFVLATSGMFYLPDTHKSGIAFAPAYFGGLHTSAYVISLATICLYFLKRAGFLSLHQFIFWLVASFLLLFVAWQVRTALVLYAFFFLLLAWKTIPTVKPWLVAFLYVGVVSGIVLLLFEVVKLPSFDHLTTFSSGRLAMWLYKLDLLAQADILQLLFGRGIGSDVVISDIWWWAAKDSHNDFLHVITELGIVGFGLAMTLLLVFRSIFPRSDFAVTALFVGYISASALSNGLMFRPAPALFFALALALSALPKVR